MAGPRRRAAVARAVASVCPGLTVRAVPGAWTVATRTGRTTVCRTLAALVATAARAGETEAAEVLAAVRATAGDAVPQPP
ncbi:hypothetical protein ACU61A_02575 [Pseudonocardia sichuanensis]